MAASLPYIGSRITLITNKNIRYEGTLVHIDPNESTVALSQVRAFGTEDRPPVDGVPVPANNDIYDYIIFRSTDIKDLTVSELPAPQTAANTQRATTEPTMMQQPQSNLYSPFGMYGAQGAQPAGAQAQQFPQNYMQQYPGMMNPWAMYSPAMYTQLLQQQQQYAMMMQQQQQLQQQQQQQPAAKSTAAAAPAAGPAAKTTAAAPAPAAQPAAAAPAPAAAQPAKAEPAKPAAAPAQTAAPAKHTAAAPATHAPVGGQKVSAPAPAQTAAPSRDPKNPWGARAAAPSTQQPAQQQQQRPAQQTQQQRPAQPQQRPAQPQQQQQSRPAPTSAPVGGVRSYAGAASRGGSVAGSSGFHRQTTHTGRFPAAGSRPGAPQRVTMPSDFDFEESNKKFDKEKIEAELEAELTKPDHADEAPADHAYVKDDFFDRLSCEALEKLQVDVDGEVKSDRNLLTEQRKKDSETFGVSAVRTQYYGAGSHHQGGQYYAAAASSTSSRGGAVGGSRGGARGGASAGHQGQRRPPTSGGAQSSSNWRNNNPSNTSGGQRGGFRGGRGGSSGGHQQQHHGNQQKVFRPVQRGDAVKS